MRVIHALKRLAWKLRDFVTDPTFKTAIHQVSIHQTFIIKFLSFELQPQPFKTNPSELQFHAQGVGFFPQYSF